MRPSNRSCNQRLVRLTVLLLLSGGLRPGTGMAAEPVRARHGMVVSESEPASRVGREVLREGGNAMDAAVAVALALAVTHPAAGNLGGGGFLVYRGSSGVAVAYDFRETAPALAHEKMFLRQGIYDAELHHHSHVSVGVPGTVAGLHLAWRDHGRLPWKHLVRPAITLAADGFVVSDSLARSLAQALPKLARSPAAYAQFTKQGRPYGAGDLLRQPDLARTLRGIARRGPAGFYQGEVAARIEQEMLAHGGWIRRSDLQAYAAKRRDPVRGTYRGYEIQSMPPPSSGGVVLVLMLNVLEGFDLAKAQPGSAAGVHLLAETMRRGFVERARYLGDPDHQPDLPAARLLAKGYAAELRKTIRLDRASVSSPDRFDWPQESSETTHLSVVDAERNAVALTYTLEESYGAGLMTPGTGFLLNNEMGDFNGAPGLTTTNGLIGTVPNLAGPGKRMLSSMTPTILTKNGQLFLVLGSPGGRTIINTVLETIVNVVDHQMNVQAAVDAPRFHHQWLPDELRFERHGLSPDTTALLRQRGHAVAEWPGPQGVVAAIRFDGVADLLEGAADRRAPDATALGW
jgi:gamma-glutamyltranspeptidase/glutathione hydrolase